MRGCPHLVDTVCQRCHLPQLPAKEFAESGFEKIQRPRNAIIVPCWDPRLQKWRHQTGSINFQVDCKALA
eukprot:1164295-Karenia_brevis.AAC.1